MHDTLLGQLLRCVDGLLSSRTAGWGRRSCWSAGPCVLTLVAGHASMNRGPGMRRQHWFFTFRPARTMFLPVGDQWMTLAAREGLCTTGCTALTADRTSFISYTLKLGLGPSPCRMAKRVPCSRTSRTESRQNFSSCNHSMSNLPVWR